MKTLTGADILQLHGADPALVAEYEKEIRRINSWRGKLALWWRRCFPPKHWVNKCSNCGHRTADSGDPPYCSRSRCQQAYLDRVASETLTEELR